ncbi:hypothetical protein INR49_007311 [Caranx melampygus]|nr:hypothetical protein INR49_007311 [Caranx melampygus]
MLKFRLNVLRLLPQSPPKDFRLSLDSVDVVGVGCVGVGGGLRNVTGKGVDRASQVYQAVHSADSDLELEQSSRRSNVQSKSFHALAHLTKSCECLTEEEEEEEEQLRGSR